MKLFTVGPVEMYPETLEIEGSQLPYFRTEEFSRVMKDIEHCFLDTLNAPPNACFVGLTCSGTGAMDAAVANTINNHDKVLVINGGSFGKRFSDICEHYNIQHDCYEIAFGKKFSKEIMETYNDKGYTALLVNACETSTGQKYDLEYLGDFCARNDMFFIVDAVSAYIADKINMKRDGIDVVLTASQKALALAPGVALVALSDKAIKRIKHNKTTYYFDFNVYIENQKRGQPPYTSAVGTMLALHNRLQNIIKRGIDYEFDLHAKRANYFRGLIKDLPIVIPNISLSNCCTPIILKNAYKVYEKMKNKYDIFLTPSGGAERDYQLRVGHLGNLKLDDYDDMVSKLEREIAK